MVDRPGRSSGKDSFDLRKDCPRHLGACRVAASPRLNNPFAHKTVGTKCKTRGLLSIRDSRCVVGAATETVPGEVAQHARRTRRVQHSTAFASGVCRCRNATHVAIEKQRGARSVHFYQRCELPIITVRRTSNEKYEPSEVRLESQLSGAPSNQNNKRLGRCVHTT